MRGGRRGLGRCWRGRREGYRISYVHVHEHGLISVEGNDSTFLHEAMHVFPSVAGDK